MSDLETLEALAAMFGRERAERMVALAQRIAKVEREHTRRIDRARGQGWPESQTPARIVIATAIEEGLDARAREHGMYVEPREEAFR